MNLFLIGWHPSGNADAAAAEGALRALLRRLPFFDPERIELWRARSGRVTMASVAHSPDIGGRIRSPEARYVYEEGLQIPVMKAVRGGKIDPVLEQFLRKNTRVPDQVMGDLYAQFTALTLMEQRVKALLAEQRLPSLEALAREIHARSEAAMRAAIRKVPDGVYRQTAVSDGFAEPIVWHTDDHCIAYRRGGLQDLLDLLRVHLLTARVDAPRSSAEQRQGAVRQPLPDEARDVEQCRIEQAVRDERLRVRRYDRELLLAGRVRR